MHSSVKKLAFVFLGLAVIVSVFLLTKSTYVLASKKDLSQQVNITQDNAQQPLALYQIGYIGPKKELKLITTLPLGVRLDSGTSIISSKKLISPGKFTVCNQSGCQSISDISEEDLQTILNTTENTVAFMNTEGKQVGIPLSTKGLSEGLKYIK